ncbi:MAG: hypothetical protein ACI8P2_004368, partial [Candidatus Latescibacterota bacterium]
MAKMAKKGNGKTAPRPSRGKEIGVITKGSLVEG